MEYGLQTSFWLEFGESLAAKRCDQWHVANLMPCRIKSISWTHIARHYFCTPEKRTTFQYSFACGSSSTNSSSHICRSLLFIVMAVLNFFVVQFYTFAGTYAGKPLHACCANFAIACRSRPWGTGNYSSIWWNAGRTNWLSGKAAGVNRCCSKKPSTDRASQKANVDPLSDMFVKVVMRWWLITLAVFCGVSFWTSFSCVEFMSFPEFSCCICTFIFSLHTDWNCDVERVFGGFPWRYVVPLESASSVHSLDSGFLQCSTNIPDPLTCK